MNIFISWSGDETASAEAAKLLKEFLPLLHDSWVPFESASGIGAATLWMDELFEALKSSEYGILCISPKQKDSPWILFEAGALSKAVTSNRVLPLLVGVEPSEVADPLTRFQAKAFDSEGLKAMIESLCEESKIPTEARRVVMTRWDDYIYDKVKGQIRKINQQAKNERSVDEPAPRVDPLEKALDDIQSRMGEIAIRMQKLTERDGQPVTTPAILAAPVSATPTPVVIPAAQPGQTITVQTPHPGQTITVQASIVEKQE